MSDVVRLVDLPDLGAVTSGSRAAGARAGAGLFAVNALRDYIVPGAAENVRSRGAVGDGVADDTAAFQAALATGRSVKVPAGRYKLTAGLVIATSGQRLFGDGERATTLVPVGSFDVVTLQGAGVEHVGVHDIGVEAAGMGGGYVVATRAAARVSVSGLLVNNPWSVALVEDCNVYAAHGVYVQRPRGPYGFHLHGPLGARSDVVRLSDINMGGLMEARGWVGIYADGEIYTVYLNSVHFVAPKIGVHFANTQGGPDPAFLVSDDLEVDFPLQESLRLDALTGGWLVNTYLQGSADTTGLLVGAATSSVKLVNGYIRGARREGVVIEGADVALSNVQVVLNGVPTYFDYDAIRIAGTARRVQITGCAMGGMKGVGAVARYGVGIAAGARDIRITGCDFYGCAAGAVNDLSGIAGPGNVTQVGGGALGGGFFVDTHIPGLQLGVVDGFGAEFSANVVAGQITSVTVLNGGAEYRTPPAVHAYGATGVGFAGVCVLVNGSVTGVTVTNPGAGYSAGVQIYARSGVTVPTIKARWPGLADIPLRLAADGLGAVTLENDGGQVLTAVAQAAAVNYLTITGTATGVSPAIDTISPAANCSLRISAKGTGTLIMTSPVSVASLTSTGAVSGASITSGGAISGSGLAVSGPITGATLGVSGIITGGSMSVPGAVSVGTLATGAALTSGGLATLASLQVVGNAGFFGATPIAKPVLTGNWGTDPSAVGKTLSILLGQLGLITDSSTNV